MTQQIDISSRNAKSLAEALAPIRRHVLPVAVIVLACGLAGYFFVSRLPVQYIAKTAVLVTDTGVGSSSTSNAKVVINLDTEAQVVTSATVLGKAITDLKLHDTPRTLGDRVTVNVPPNTEILSIGVTSDSAAEATREAAGIAQAYLSSRNSAAESVRGARIKAMDARAKDLQTQADKTSDELVKAKDANDDSKQQLLQGSYKRLTSQQSTIAQQINGLELKVISGGRVLSPATATPASSKLTILLGGISGVAIGLFLGFGFAAALDRIRRRITSGAEVAALTHLPILVRQPVELNEHSDLDPSTPTRKPRTAKTFTRLRNELDRTGGSSKVIVIAGVGAPTAHPAAVRLAYSYRRSGRRVALMDRFNWQEEPSFEPGATESDMTVEALQTVQLIGDQVNAIIVLAPDFAASPDAQTLAAHADVVLLVVQRGATRPRDLRDAEAQLQAVRARAYVVMTSAAGSGIFRRIGTLLSKPRHAGAQSSAGAPVDIAGGQPSQAWVDLTPKDRLPEPPPGRAARPAPEPALAGSAPARGSSASSGRPGLRPAASAETQPAGLALRPMPHRGVNGAAGPANGSNGANGANGSNGSSGANGSNGANGSSGANGSNGSNGARNANGAPPKGVTGRPGSGPSPSPEDSGSSSTDR